VTILAEDLRRQAEALSQRHRFPSLEKVLSRGRPCRIDSASSNHLRFSLFGVEPEGMLPVAALTHVSDRGDRAGGDYFWLRTDPVTMWADMARVFMTNYGFADLDPYERNEVENCIRGVLLEEGITLYSDHPERWCIALESPLEFEFTPLEQALGMDVADALPDHPEARFWRRILNEIQVSLHHCPVNVRRRASGRREINSVWFWGGGFIPDAAPHDPFDSVYSNHPVSRGLAIINDCRLKKQHSAAQGGFGNDGRSVLIDWLPEIRDPVQELGKLDRLIYPLLQRVEDNRLVLSLYDGSGEGWMFDRRARRRFWRRITAIGPVAAEPARA
jgi:hypothetical protein